MTTRITAPGLLRWCVALTLTFGANVAIAQHPTLWLENLFGKANDAVHRHPPATGKDTAIEHLASNIDWLEFYLDCHGSVVAKHPDIWGEARLTAHREEYERVMQKDLDAFQLVLNGAMRTEDRAFLASATALSAAASGQTAAVPTETTTTMTNMVFPQPAAAAEEGSGEEGGGEGEGDGSTTPPPVQIIATAGTGASLFTDVARSEPTTVGATGFTFGGNFAHSGNIGLEPTIFLDQKSRYLDHLHELRRIHEGDDTSDSPGYSLNLIRIPVSILPGTKTRKGYGAEITITATPVVSDSLMGDTFRNLVINDLVELYGLPVVKVSERYLAALREGQARLATQKAELDATFARLHAERTAVAAQIAAAEADEQRNLALADADLTKPETYFAPGASLAFESAIQSLRQDWSEKTYSDLRSVPQLERAPLESLLTPDLQTQIRGQLMQSAEDARTRRTNALQDQEDLARRIADLDAQILGVQDQMRRNSLDVATLASRLEVPSAGTAARDRRFRSPLSNSQFLWVVGEQSLVVPSRDFADRYAGRNVRWNGGGGEKEDSRIDLLDVQKYLKGEFNAAYDLLSRQDALGHVLAAIAYSADRESLASKIRRNDAVAVDAARRTFVAAIHQTIEQGPLPSAELTRAESSRLVIETLAWPIVVEMALLQEQLIEDMRRTAKYKDCLYDCQVPLQYYLPVTCLDPENFYHGEYVQAAQAFSEYVRCRWPVHVFALDPVAQQQNIADSSRRQRELDLALALAFVNGQISAQNMTRYRRQVAQELDVIDLNEPIVGFGHGEDTFGWRFSPRVQTPPPPGQITALSQTLFGGPSRDADLLEREIEPGMRECTAVVLMPSFVPFCDFDIRTNWYCLTNPRETELSMKETVHLSRAITAMHQSSAICSECAHLYRPGEVSRLLARVKQLDRELPLQSMRAQVPFENTLGGFEMFNTGMTDLAPELAGWYGAPGVMIEGTACTGCPETAVACALDGTTCAPVSVAAPVYCPGSGTTLFLVGDNFSVHGTRVIAGGVCIPHFRLVSRQIMQVTIPPCVNTVLIEKEKYVAVYVASPYGVTNHLHVPVVQGKPGDSAVDAAKKELATALDAKAKEIKQSLGYCPELHSCVRLLKSYAPPLANAPSIPPREHVPTLELDPATLVSKHPAPAFEITFRRYPRDLQGPAPPVTVNLYVALGDKRTRRLVADPRPVGIPNPGKNPPVINHLPVSGDEIVVYARDVVAAAAADLRAIPANQLDAYEFVFYVGTCGGPCVPTLVDGTVGVGQHRPDLYPAPTPPTEIPSKCCQLPEPPQATTLRFSEPAVLR